MRTKIFAATALLVAILSGGCANRPPAPDLSRAQAIVRWTNRDDSVALPLGIIVENGLPTDIAVFLPFLGTEEAFVIDTGASRSWISPELCAAKDLAATETVKVTGLGGSKSVFRRTTAVRVDLGFAIVERWPLVVGTIPTIDRRNSHWRKTGQPVVVGLLGADLLHALEATIDYRQQEIRFRRPGSQVGAKGALVQ